MDCEVSESGSAICGNFAELLPEKPKDFDYEKTGKWLEPYSFEWRETLGDAVCNCTQLEVHYAPYYGFDHFHMDNCNLMRKLARYPSIMNLYEIFLPHVTYYTTAVPNTGKLRIWVDKRGGTKKIKVKHHKNEETRQLCLV